MPRAYLPATIDDILYGGEENKKIYLENKASFEEAQEDQGILGTSWRGPEEVLWTVQISSIILASIAGGASLIYLKFILIPCIMAYLITFLQVRITDLLGRRPLTIGSKNLCETKFADPDMFLSNKNQTGFVKKTDPEVTMTNEEWEKAEEREAEEGIKRACLDFFVLGKLPRSIAILLTLVVTVTIITGIILLLVTNYSQFAADEEEKEANGEESLSVKLTNYLNDQIDYIETNWGVSIYRELICPETDMSGLALHTSVVPAGNDKISDLTMFMVTGLDTIKPNMTEVISSCWRKDLFGTSEGTKWDDLVDTGYSLALFLSDLILVTLLSVYILMASEGPIIQGDAPVYEELEDMINSYISLKTAISLATGVLSGGFLLIAGVQMAVIFGFLSFLLNFIPMVGSMIAIILPLPIIILDDSLKSWQVIIALTGPTLVQAYIGNILEPTVFGKSLNLTAISVLISLVLCSLLWGIPGAILSVPLLGAAKIVLHYTDHPLAKVFLKILREDPLVDYDKMIERQNQKLLVQQLTNDIYDSYYDDVDIDDTDYENEKIN